MKKIPYLFLLAIFSIIYVACSTSESGGGGGDVAGLSDGTGGSMARFTIRGDILYTVSTDTLKMFNITDPRNPIYSSGRDILVGSGIETVFTMDTLLFIGAQAGMYVYNITTKFPEKLGSVSHLRSCDPVVAQGKYAYVTLNTNIISQCGTSINNVLNVYDISNPVSMLLKKSINLSGPQGLGIDGDKLFICDKGLKVFNIQDPLNPKQIDDLADIEDVDVSAAYDVIPVPDKELLILVAAEGLYQFDYSGQYLKFVSKLLVTN